MGSRAKVAIDGCGARAIGEEGAAVDKGCDKLGGGGDVAGGSVMGDGGEVGGGGVMGGGSAGNGGSDGVAGLIGLGRDPRGKIEAPSEYISSDRSGEVAHGTHL